MKKLKYFLFLLVCLLGGTASAQNIRIVLENPADIPSVITVGVGDTFSFDVWAHNDDTVVYHDVLNYSYQIQHGDTFFSSTPNPVAGFFWFSDTINVIPGDSVFRTIYVKVEQPAFKTGPSVVIIWPVAAGVYGNPITIDFGTVLSIDDAADEKMSFVMRGNNLFIKRKDVIQLNRLRVYDIAGRLIYDAANPANSTPLPLSSTGTYIAEVTYNSTQRKVFRFVY